MNKKMYNSMLATCGTAGSLHLNVYYKVKCAAQLWVACELDSVQSSMQQQWEIKSFHKQDYDGIRNETAILELEKLYDKRGKFKACYAMVLLIDFNLT